MHPPTVRKGQSCQIYRLPSLETSDLACKTKSMSTSDNLIEAVWTTLVQAPQTYNSHTYRDYRSQHWTTLIHALGLDKLITLLLVEATTPDIRQSSMLDNLFRLQASSELGGLMYCPRSTK